MTDDSKIFYRKTGAGLLIPSKDEREYERTPKNSGCCSLHWMPAGEVCEDFQYDDGGGILIAVPVCNNCWYFNNRQLKHKKVVNLNDRG